MHSVAFAKKCTREIDVRKGHHLGILGAYRNLESHGFQAVLSELLLTLPVRREACINGPGKLCSPPAHTVRGYRRTPV